MTPLDRSRAALPANIRKTLEESSLPIEVATAIADLCEMRPEAATIEHLQMQIGYLATMLMARGYPFTLPEIVEEAASATAPTPQESSEK